MEKVSLSWLCLHWLGATSCVTNDSFVSISQLHYYRLPKDISEDHVILMDATVATGAAGVCIF